ncbi:FecR family protein [Mucilaginibacter gracilis]|nr:FecR family protein [Mucilaginibacter gracilis]
MESQETLFIRFIRNECTREEIEALLAQFNSGDNESVLREIILEQLKNEEDIPGLQLPDLSEKEELIYAALLPHLKEKRLVRLWPRIAAAASIIIALSFGGYFLTHKKQPQPTLNLAKNDVAPGGNKAILTLSNGKQISLTDAGKGKLAQQNNTTINKTADGQIVYNQTASPSTKQVQIAYNTITTPRGGKYNLVLADGTIATLDAASSIKYPVAFTGSERKVEITGQVYFEVVHNASKPFRVVVKGETIEDLGTHFNINAYDDEPAIVTTLVEGSIKVNKDGQSVLLKPGQEALATHSLHKILVRKANIQQAIAWKDGLFRFDQTELKTLMRQVSRWYNLNVVYQGSVVNDEFDGQIPRDVKLSQLLKILASNQVHFEIENNGTTKTLIIKP